MRRAVVFCQWRSQWWRERAQYWANGEDEATYEGRRAYALQHAEAEQLLADHWAQQWAELREKAQEFMRNHPMLPARGNPEMPVANANAEEPVADGGPANEDAREGAREAAVRENADVPLVPPNVPVIELELEEDEGYADDYYFHIDEF